MTNGTRFVLQKVLDQDCGSRDGEYVDEDACHHREVSFGFWQGQDSANVGFGDNVPQAVAQAVFGFNAMPSCGEHVTKFVQSNLDRR